MKRIFTAGIFLVLTSSLFASESCITNGDCQRKLSTEAGINTYKVKVGVDALGKEVCALRAYNVELGHSCQKEEGKIFGVCVKDQEVQVSYDSSNPTSCEGAIEL